MSSQQVNGVFSAIRAKLNRALQDMPLIVGNAAVNYSMDAFRKQSWDGVPWQKRKSKKDASRQLLVKSGRGRRSVRIVRTTPNSVTVGSDLPYMRIHNEGGTINRAARSETFVRNRYTRGAKGKMFGGMGAFKKGTTSGQGLSFKAYSYQMPARPFLKRSRMFEINMQLVVRTELQKALK